MRPASRDEQDPRGSGDLFAIRTMGFRGEALPSIGSVSQVRIVSRPGSADAAHEIYMAGDTIGPISAAGGPPGTTVEVRELFFNVPARQKFLRTAQTEMGHITEQAARIALAHTDIEFRLTHNGRLVHHLRPTDSLRARIADLYGADLADRLLEFSRDERGLKISGFAGPPADSRSSSKWQYIFLNGRFIRDRFVSHAAREAYRGLIDPSRYPVFFICLEIDPESVDVNVHPTKSEVRWQDSNIVYSQVLSVLRDRFLNANLTPAYRPRTDQPASETDEMEEAHRRQARQSIADFFKRVSPPTGQSSSASGLGTGSSWSVPRPPAGSMPSYRPSPSMPEPMSEPAGFEKPFADPPPTTETAPPAQGLPVYRNVIQVHNAFLVAETEDGLTIVDQHALHERILYELLSHQITEGPLESQRLLIPEMIDVAPGHLALIETHADTLALLGFDLNPAGPGTLAIQACPSLLKPERVTSFIRDVLDRLADRDAPASSEMLLDALISMMACKAAVKAGDPLAPEEIESLMAQREMVERATNCPHGRPTALSLSLQDLEKQFKRT